MTKKPVPETPGVEPDRKLRKSQFVSRGGMVYKLQVSLKLVKLSADQLAPDDLESMPTPPRIM